MREHNRDKERLEHILEAISVIDVFVGMRGWYCYPAKRFCYQSVKMN